MLIKNSAFVIVALTLVCESVLGKPAPSDTGYSSICYDLKCPETATSCGKTSEISSTDKSKLNIQIKCFDGLGNILMSKNTTEDNPFGPGVYYKGTKLSSVIRDPFFLDTDDDDEDQGISIGNIFQTYLSDNDDKYPTKPKSIGPKSEVEDLNSR